MGVGVGLGVGLGVWVRAATWPGGAEAGRPVCSLGRLLSEEGRADPIRPLACRDRPPRLPSCCRADPTLEVLSRAEPTRLRYPGLSSSILMAD